MSRNRDNLPAEEAPEGRVRADQWLWAARFFKTRALAAAAVDGGRVTVNGDRIKRARLLRVGDEVSVRLSPYVHVVRVTALAARRGSAQVAQGLYEETSESVEARERLRWQLRNASALSDYDRGRPTKRDRREIGRLKGRDS